VGLRVLPFADDALIVGRIARAFVAGVFLFVLAFFAVAFFAGFLVDAALAAVFFAIFFSLQFY
jgi:hypothetical protein